MAARSDFSALEQFEQWLNLSEAEQDAVIRNLEQQLGDDYNHQYTLSYTNQLSFRIPTFNHAPTGLEFNLIVGGEFNRGLSVEEEAEFRRLIEQERLDEEYFLGFIDSMRPVHRVRVRPFLMSRLPITNVFAREHLGLNLDDYISDYEVDSDWEQQLLPASLSREQVNQLVEKFRFSLPSEAQWEYAYRGGTTTLFPILNEEKIAFSEFSDPKKCREAANPFGLVGMAVGEWCADSYRPNYNDASDNDLPVVGESPYVVRGGAAISSPWQGVGEWLTCVSAMRLWEDDSLDSQGYSGRFVKVL